MILERTRINGPFGAYMRGRFAAGFVSCFVLCPGALNLASPTFPFVPIRTPTFLYLSLCSPIFPYVPLSSPTFPFLPLPSPTFSYLPLPSPTFP